MAEDFSQTAKTEPATLRIGKEPGRTTGFHRRTDVESVPTNLPENRRNTHSGMSCLAAEVVGPLIVESEAITHFHEMVVHLFA